MTFHIRFFLAPSNQTYLFLLRISQQYTNNRHSTISTPLQVTFIEVDCFRSLQQYGCELFFFISKYQRVFSFVTAQVSYNSHSISNKNLSLCVFDVYINLSKNLALLLWLLFLLLSLHISLCLFVIWLDLINCNNFQSLTSQCFFFCADCGIFQMECPYTLRIIIRIDFCLRKLRANCRNLLL